MQKLIQKYSDYDKELLQNSNVKELLKSMYTNYIVSLDNVESVVGIGKVEASWYFPDLVNMNLIQRYGKNRNDNKYTLTYKGKKFVRDYLL